MKIRALTLRPYRQAFRTSLRTSRALVAERRGFVVRMERDDGLMGSGEAAPLELAGTDTVARTEVVLERVAARCIGRTLPMDVTDVGRWVDDVIQASDAPAARCGVETAVLDALARARGLPVRALLGGTATSVPVQALLTSVEPEALAREAAEAVARGHRTVKLKVASAGSDDVARLQAVRVAVGSEVRIRIDANGAWSLAEAVLRLQALERFGVEFCEDPVAAPCDEELERLARASRIAVAADAWLVSSALRSLVLARPELVAVLILKPMALGGVLPAYGLARAATDRGQRCVVTSTLDGPLGRLAAAHLAAAVTDGTTASGLATGALFEAEYAKDSAPPADGIIHLPTGPGLGLDEVAS